MGVQTLSVKGRSGLQTNTHDLGIYHNDNGEKTRDKMNVTRTGTSISVMFVWMIPGRTTG